MSLPRRQVITVNIYRNMHEAFQTFDYISQAGNFGWVSREAGAWQPAPAARCVLACLGCDARGLGAGLGTEHELAAQALARSRLPPAPS